MNATDDNCSNTMVMKEMILEKEGGKGGRKERENTDSLTKGDNDDDEVRVKKNSNYVHE